MSWKVLTCWLGVSAMVSTPLDARGATCVGLPDSPQRRSVAVRGIVQTDGVVSALRYFSNDATVFRSIALCRDAGLAALPHPGDVVTQVVDVGGALGDVVVRVDPVAVTAGDMLWVVLEFPASGRLTGQGIGGGPGIAWTENETLGEERSFYSIGEAQCEFAKTFDLSIVAGTDMAKARQPMEVDRSPASVIPHVESDAVLFTVRRPEAGAVTLDVFDVSGRRIASIVEDSKPPGTHTMAWRLSGAGQPRVASGVYWYRAQIAGAVRTGRLVILR